MYRVPARQTIGRVWARTTTHDYVCGDSIICGYSSLRLTKDQLPTLTSTEIMRIASVCGMPFLLLPQSIVLSYSPKKPVLSKGIPMPQYLPGLITFGVLVLAGTDQAAFQRLLLAFPSQHQMFVPTTHFSEDHEPEPPPWRGLCLPAMRQRHARRGRRYAGAETKK